MESLSQKPPSYAARFRRRGLLLVVAILFGMLGSIALAQPSAQTAVYNDVDQVFAIIGELNAWRLDEGLAPLRINDTLMKMAMFQAEYLMGLRSIPDGAAIHRGRDGEGVRERARYSQFDWPHYARSEQIAIGEIAAVYTLSRAIAFWRSSPPHRRTVTNPAYREIGVAAIPRRTNTLYVVVMGARPDVLPALVHPETNQLYLTRDQYPSAIYHDSLVNPDRVRLFDADGRPLDDWQPWSETIDIPDNSPSPLYVLYADDDQLAMSAVDLTRDIVILPGYQPPAESFAFVPTPTPGPTATPPPPTPTPIPRPALTLIYNPMTLTIVNTSGRPLNLFPFSLASGSFSLPLNWWREVFSFPMAEFPPQHCLQVSVAGVVQPLTPSDCQLVRARRNIRPPVTHFWAEGTFEVRAQGQRLATCQADEGRCEVFLP
ncbi:MAG: CAP domain-containing protein [Phototrophicaceae bacterium]